MCASLYIELIIDAEMCNFTLFSTSKHIQARRGTHFMFQLVIVYKNAYGR